MSYSEKFYRGRESHGSSAAVSAVINLNGKRESAGVACVVRALTFLRNGLPLQKKFSPSANMHLGSLGNVGLGFAQHLAGDRCDFAFSQGQKAQQVRKGFPSVQRK